MKRILFDFRGRKYLFIIILFVFLSLVVFLLYWKTGFFGSKNMDKKDMQYWDYKDGLIVGADAFGLNGSKDVCWLLIHGYEDTPNSMRGVAGAVNNEFGDYVYTVRLWGHGEVPSHLLNYTLDDWYRQISADFERLDSECGAVNVLGFSFGGALTLRLAEDKELNHVYLIGAFLQPPYKFYYILPSLEYLDVFSDSFQYIKKSKVSNINSPEGLATHISYWSFVLPPVKGSENFLAITKENVAKVEEPILVLHSTGDSVADYKMGEFIYDGVSSKIKDIVLFKKSDHIILADYDKDDAIAEVVKFEAENRD